MLNLRSSLFYSYTSILYPKPSFFTDIHANSISSKLCRAVVCFSILLCQFWSCSLKFVACAVSSCRTIPSEKSVTGELPPALCRRFFAILWLVVGRPVGGWMFEWCTPSTEGAYLSSLRRRLCDDSRLGAAMAYMFAINMTVHRALERANVHFVRSTGQTHPVGVFGYRISGRYPGWLGLESVDKRRDVFRFYKCGLAAGI
ncbi:hypothetical protein EDC01DRAFT_371095 [Geopyxis carbonaria]|nr:hypothetical protein EDC01DRAFT_371095 [Geopyxis carbonaria]